MTAAPSTMSLSTVAARPDVDALTLVAYPMPSVPAPQLVAAFGAETIFAWSAPSGQVRVLVGVGVAREFRGAGDTRWQQVVAATSRLRVTVSDERGDVDAGSDLDGPRGAWPLLRARLVGGAAFAPGAADKAPWTGFGDAWFALPRWTYVSNDHGAYLLLALDASDDASRYAGDLARWRAAIRADAPSTLQPTIVEHLPGATAEWRARIEAITAAIARGELSKVVAARPHGLALAGAARPEALLAALDARHAECTRVLVRPPGAGALVAATPEQLVRRDGSLVTCDALAGTSRVADAAAAEALLASAKDRWEHDLVVTAIRDALTAAGARVDAPAVPRIRALRHVLHLHTPFRAELAAPTHVLELAARLHPTPAVGGTPTASAVTWIREHESARGWYASPVGWCDLEGNGELAVAIRSGVLAGAKVHLWAGAGIVAGSDPERELVETELKLRAMLGALGGADPT